MSLVTEEIKAKSKIYYGDKICQEKLKSLLKVYHMPSGILQVEDIQELGYEKESDFTWLKLKSKSQYKNKKLGTLSSFDTEITAYVEPKRIKRVTGVKSREFMIWFTVSEIYVDDPLTGKVTFKTSSGLSKSHPVSLVEEKAERVK